MRNTERINQKLNEVWAEKTVIEQKPEATKKIILPPDHILNYRNKEKITEEKQPEDNIIEEKISYIKAKEILGIQNIDTISCLIWKKKLIGSRGFVTLKSVEEYKRDRLPKGNAALMILRQKKHTSPNEISYQRAMEILGVERHCLYNMISRKQIKGGDGYCDLESVLNYRKPKTGRPLKNKKTKEVECLMPDKIVIPTLADVEIAIREAEIKDDNMKDAINPDHYAIGGINAIDYFRAKSTKEEFRGYLRLTAMKYLTRLGHKDSELQELKKAKWFIDELIKEYENENI